MELTGLAKYAPPDNQKSIQNQLKSIQNQLKSIQINPKPIKIIKINPKPIKTNKKHPKSIKINKNDPKSIKIGENPSLLSPWGGFYILKNIHLGATVNATPRYSRQSLGLLRHHVCHKVEPFLAEAHTYSLSIVLYKTRPRTIELRDFNWFGIIFIDFNWFWIIFDDFNWFGIDLNWF